MNVTELLYTVFSVVFLPNNTSPPEYHSLGQYRYQYTVDTPIEPTDIFKIPHDVQYKSQQKSEDYSKYKT